MEKMTRRFGVLLAVGAAALLSLGMAGTAMASASQPGVHAVPQQTTVSSSSAAGTWHNYKDSFGDSGETLTLSSNGKAKFSSGCSGVWSQLGKSVGIAIDPATCDNNLWDFTGAVKNGGHLLSGKGEFLEGGSTKSFTWSATS